MSIILDHVNYIYDKDTAFERHALKDVNLQLQDGEFIGLIGHTGSGKSTLVQLLNGLLKPSAGAVYFDGADISDDDFDLKNLRASVGLVFQYPEHQLFETDVFQDVCFGPKNLGLSKKDAELRAFQALKQVGLKEEYFYQSPFDLSGGEKRRVAIAGVLAMQPKVLVLDEPTAGLDPKGREDILNMIAQLHKELHNTIVLVSHSMEDVADYVERIIVMNKGEVLYDAAPQEVFTHVEELEAVHLAVPEVTYIMRDLARAGIKVRTDVTTVEEAVEEILACYGR
ncbi:MAG: energy-coupling factor transporter ATPase [Lachnospiraceae bacterium]|nr:energy-coupling factor transporter ATPase [Lachnospiraceae bacterium]